MTAKKPHYKALDDANRQALAIIQVASDWIQSEKKVGHKVKLTKEQKAKKSAEVKAEALTRKENEKLWKRRAKLFDSTNSMSYRGSLETFHNAEHVVSIRYRDYGGSSVSIGADEITRLAALFKTANISFYAEATSGGYGCHCNGCDIETTVTVTLENVTWPDGWA